MKKTRTTWKIVAVVIIGAFLATAFFGVFGQTEAVATTIYVPDNYSTIREAINVANKGDTIIIAVWNCIGTPNKNLTWDGKHILFKSVDNPKRAIITGVDFSNASKVGLGITDTVNPIVLFTIPGEIKVLLFTLEDSRRC